MSTPFRQVSRRLIVLLAAGGVLAGCKDFKASYDKKFKESYAREFGVSCTQAAVKNGSPEDKVKPICTCMGDFLAANETTTDLTKMAASPDAPDSKKMIEAATKACMPPAAK